MNTQIYLYIFLSQKLFEEFREVIVNFILLEEGGWQEYLVMHKRGPSIINGRLPRRFQCFQREFGIQRTWRAVFPNRGHGGEERSRRMNNLVSIKRRLETEETLVSRWRTGRGSSLTSPQLDRQLRRRKLLIC